MDGNGLRRHRGMMISKQVSKFDYDRSTSMAKVASIAFQDGKVLAGYSENSSDRVQHPTSVAIDGSRINTLSILGSSSPCKSWGSPLLLL